jgi:aspartate/tyrosine/aromatic aminotransferase
MPENEETFIARLKRLQEQTAIIIQELEANPHFPDGHIITKESWDNADKITHDGFVYVKYNDLCFYK